MMQRIHNTKLTHLTAMVGLMRNDDSNRQWSDYECVEWTMGVPSIYIDGSLYELQKAAYIVAYGAIPESNLVWRMCQKHLCFRPSHLQAYPTSMDFLKDLVRSSLEDSGTWSSYPCIEWPFAKLASSYGRLSDGSGGYLLAHRAAYELAYGPSDLPNICHHCDNPKCVRPIHLFAGTQADNIQDAIRKGRINCAGENNSAAKLSEAQVREIVVLKASGMRSVDIAERFKVSNTAVKMIISGRSWQHITGLPG